jgi:hypothetical protein
MAPWGQVALLDQPLVDLAELEVTEMGRVHRGPTASMAPDSLCPATMERLVHQERTEPS